MGSTNEIPERKKVIVFNRNMSTLHMIKTSLDRFDVKSIFTQHGSDCINILLKDPENFYLAILDIDDLSEGIETLIEIKGNPTLSRIPVIAICDSDTSNKERSDAIKLGCLDVLVKDMVPEKYIRGVIQTCLSSWDMSSGIKSAIKKLSEALGKTSPDKKIKTGHFSGNSGTINLEKMTPDEIKDCNAKEIEDETMNAICEIRNQYDWDVIKHYLLRTTKTATVIDILKEHFETPK